MATNPRKYDREYKKEYRRKILNMLNKIEFIGCDGMLKTGSILGIMIETSELKILKK